MKDTIIYAERMFNFCYELIGLKETFHSESEIVYYFITNTDVIHIKIHTFMSFYLPVY